MPTKVQVQTRLNGEETDFLCEPRQSLLPSPPKNL